MSTSAVRPAAPTGLTKLSETMASVEMAMIFLRAGTPKTMKYQATHNAPPGTQAQEDSCPEDFAAPDSCQQQGVLVGGRPQGIAGDGSIEAPELVAGRDNEQRIDIGSVEGQELELDDADIQKD